MIRHFGRISKLIHKLINFKQQICTSRFPRTRQNVSGQIEMGKGELIARHLCHRLCCLQYILPPYSTFYLHSHLYEVRFLEPLWDGMRQWGWCVSHSLCNQIPVYFAKALRAEAVSECTTKWCKSKQATTNTRRCPLCTTRWNVGEK